MLVLTRKADEFLLIGEEVEVRVLRIEGDHVKLGIVAPRRIGIVRGELIEDIRSENVSAAAGAVHELAGLSAKLRQSGLKLPTKPGTQGP
ncbi:MAG: carbon storage regulator [Planctomycetota bacterium]